MSSLHRETTFGAMFCHALSRNEGRIAFEEADRKLTYGEAAASVARTLAAYDELGIRHGDGILFLGGNSVDLWIAQAAAFVAGCRVTPLHSLGSASDHNFVSKDSEAGALVYSPSSYGARAAEIAAAQPQLTMLSLGPSETGQDLLGAAAAVSPSELVSLTAPEDVAWLPYTGGTTGRPKGVMLPQRSMAMNVWLTLTQFEWPAENRFGAFAPISHGCGLMILPTLLQGGTVFMADRFDAAEFLQAAEEGRVTTAFLVPTMIYMLLEELAGRPAPRSLQTIVYGGSAMSPTRMAEALEVFGPIFNQLYAQTEAPNTATVLRKEEHDLARPHLLASCGRAMMGVEVKVLDESNAEVPVGEVGHVCIRGPLVMDGYWRQPDLTAAALADGWLHTGDLARQDEDGYFFIVDREKDMIISGGFNVFAREVEDVLTSHPSVHSAAVIGAPDPRWGEAVWAIVVADREIVDEEELIDHVKAVKGSVQAPKKVIFADEIPMTALAKPDKPELRRIYVQ